MRHETNISKEIRDSWIFSRESLFVRLACILLSWSRWFIYKQIIIINTVESSDLRSTSLRTLTSIQGREMSRESFRFLLKLNLTVLSRALPVTNEITNHCALWDQIKNLYYVSGEWWVWTIPKHLDISLQASGRVLRVRFNTRPSFFVNPSAFTLK